MPKFPARHAERIAFATILASLASGCTTPTQNLATTTEQAGTAATQLSQTVTTPLPASKPLTDFVAVTFPSRATSGALCRQAYQDVYARLEVVPHGISYANGQPLKDKSFGDALKRLFVRAKTTSFALTLKVYESHYLPEISHKLLVITTSDVDKNETRKDLVDRRVISPYFLVDDSFTFHLSAEPQSQSTIDPHALRLITNILQTSATFLAPGSTLATAVTKPKFEAEARNFDSAIGKAFSSNRQESVNTDIAVQSPARVSLSDVAGETGSVADITLYPDEKNDDRSPMATWSVRMGQPRPSMFVESSFDYVAPSGKACFALTNDDLAAIRTAQLASAKKAFEGVSADDILSFRISKEQTLRQNITTKTWYSEALVSTGKATAITQDVWQTGLGNLCKAARQDYDSFGFNSSDAAALLWATIRDLPTRPKTGDWLAAATAPTACATSFERMRALGLSAS